jgi:hypothetical protein
MDRVLATIPIVPQKGTAVNEPETPGFFTTEITEDTEII